MQGQRPNPTATPLSNSMDLKNGSWTSLRSMPRNFGERSSSSLPLDRAQPPLHWTPSMSASLPTPYRSGSFAAPLPQRVTLERSSPQVTDAEIRKYVANMQLLDAIPHIGSAEMSASRMCQGSPHQAQGDSQDAVLASVLGALAREEQRQAMTETSSPARIAQAPCRSPIPTLAETLRSTAVSANCEKEAAQVEPHRSALAVEQLQHKNLAVPTEPVLPRAVTDGKLQDKLHYGPRNTSKQQHTTKHAMMEVSQPRLPASAVRTPVKKSAAGRLPAKVLDATDASPRSSVSTNASTGGSRMGSDSASPVSVVSFHLDSPAKSGASSPRWWRC